MLVMFPLKKHCRDSELVGSKDRGNDRPTLTRLISPQDKASSQPLHVALACTPGGAVGIVLLVVEIHRGQLYRHETSVCLCCWGVGAGELMANSFIQGSRSLWTQQVKKELSKRICENESGKTSWWK